MGEGATLMLSYECGDQQHDRCGGEAFTGSHPYMNQHPCSCDCHLSITEWLANRSNRPPPVSGNVPEVDSHQVDRRQAGLIRSMRRRRMR